MIKSEYLTEYDRIVKTMQMYVDGSKQGKSELMRPAFHPEAPFFGYAGEQLAVGTKFLFDWIDQNGTEPWACSGCDCTARLEQKLKNTGPPLLESLRGKIRVPNRKS